MRARDLAVNLGLSAGSLLLCVLAIEATLRLTGLQTVAPNPPRIYRASADKLLSYELIPGVREAAFRSVVTVNEVGFRGEPPAPGDKLLAVLGDSMTFGYGVADDESLPARLDARLDGWSVLNGAVPGYDLAQEIRVWETKMAPLKPAALTLVFYPNDLTDERAFLDPQGVLRALSWDGRVACSPVETGVLSWVPGRCWMDLHSALYKVLKKVVTRRTNEARLAEQQEAAAAGAGEPAIDPKRWEEYRSLFTRFSADLGDVPRLLVLFPDQYVRKELRRDLRVLAAENGWAVVDLFDTFQNRVPVLGWDTVHATAGALDRAAEVVTEALRREGIVR